jgi:hypothetical protein
MEECKNQKVNIIQGDPFAALYAQNTFEAGQFEKDMSFSKTIAVGDEENLNQKQSINITEDSISEEGLGEDIYKLCCGEDFVISELSESVSATYQGGIGPGF